MTIVIPDNVVEFFSSPLFWWPVYWGGFVPTFAYVSRWMCRNHTDAFDRNPEFIDRVMFLLIGAMVAAVWPVGLLTPVVLALYPVFAVLDRLVLPRGKK